MGIVKDVTKNVNGEVTGASILKGKTKEVVKRHVTTLIPLLSNNELEKESNFVVESELTSEDTRISGSTPTPGEGVSIKLSKKKRRKAALESESLTKRMLDD